MSDNMIVKDWTIKSILHGIEWYAWIDRVVPEGGQKLVAAIARGPHEKKIADLIVAAPETKKTLQNLLNVMDEDCECEHGFICTRCGVIDEAHRILS